MKHSILPRNQQGFTLIEGLVVLVVLLIVGRFVFGIIYKDAMQRSNVWFEETFGISHLWITVPLLVVYIILLLMRSNHLVWPSRSGERRKNRMKLPKD